MATILAPVPRAFGDMYASSCLAARVSERNQAELEKSKEKYCSWLLYEKSNSEAAVRFMAKLYGFSRVS